MDAGQTKMKVGTIVEICNLKGEEKYLNGKRGMVTHPFAFGETRKGWVGIWLDAGSAPMPYGGNCNVRVTECKIIE